MGRRALAIVAASLLLIGTAGPAAATTTKVATSGVETLTGIDAVAPTFDPVTGIFSLRGETHYSTVTTTTHWAAGDQVTVWDQVGDFNYDILIATGAGTFWGSTELKDGAGSTLKCHYEGTFPAMTGHSVCRGYGAFLGLQTRADLAVTLTGSVQTGYLFMPGDK